MPIILLLCIFLLNPFARAELRSIGPAPSEYSIGITIGRSFDVAKDDNNSGNYLFSLHLQKELIIADHVSMAANFYPVVFYTSSEKNVFAMAIGASQRVFADPAIKEGFYGQISAAILIQRDYFSGNSSLNNFFTQLGVGYQWFEMKRTITAKLQHISNANTKRENKGINCFTLGTDFLF